MVRWRTTGILLIILLILLAITYGVTRYGPRPETTTTARPPLFSFGLQDVRRVEIVQGEARVVLGHEGSLWHVLVPSAGDADTEEIDRRVRSLVALVPFDSFPANDLSPYGLESPAARIFFLTDQGGVTLLVGDVTPTGSDRYVMLEGSNLIHVVSKVLVDRVLEWTADPPYRPTPTPTTSP